ncbi:TPA: hypothetical protein DDW35_10925 [Candidatus Sumerlaeota bacterium]|nr:hypothetical protein [Candidatus Sumerlaeota bacterium]
MRFAKSSVSDETQVQTKATKNKNGWTTIRKQIAALENPSLLVLIKELYDVSETARDLLNTKFGPCESRDAILEKCRKKVVDQFFPARGFGKLKLGEARKAIRDYRKITQDIPGVADLLMTYVENGAKFTMTYGDIDERFYDSVESALRDLAALLYDELPDFYPLFRDRLSEVEEITDGVGWGFHDCISEVVFDLESRLGRE